MTIVGGQAQERLTVWVEDFSNGSVSSKSGALVLTEKVLMFRNWRWRVIFPAGGLTHVVEGPGEGSPSGGPKSRTLFAGNDGRAYPVSFRTWERRKAIVLINRAMAGSGPRFGVEWRTPLAKLVTFLLWVWMILAGLLFVDAMDSNIERVTASVVSNEQTQGTNSCQVTWPDEVGEPRPALTVGCDAGTEPGSEVVAYHDDRTVTAELSWLKLAIDIWVEKQVALGALIAAVFLVLVGPAALLGRAQDGWRIRAASVSPEHQARLPEVAGTSLDG